jgi:hypothetical protein
MADVITTIKGLSPLMQHKFSNQAEAALGDETRPVQLDRLLPREQAEQACYRDGEDFCYFPGQAIARLLREAGSSHKQRGSRRSVKYLVPAAVIVPDDAIHILDAEGKKVDDFEVDSRPVTIPATKGRIMRHRPRWDEWTATFALDIDDTVLPEELIHQLLEEGGRRIGIGDYRPESGGPFGRFSIVEWRLIPS